MIEKYQCKSGCVPKMSRLMGSWCSSCLQNSTNPFSSSLTLLIPLTPQPKQPLLTGPFPVFLLENMGFDNRSEKGHGKGTLWPSPQQPETHQGMRLDTRGGTAKGHLWQWTDKVMEILRMGSETWAQCHGNTVKKGKNISLYTLWHTNILFKAIKSWT